MTRDVTTDDLNRNDLSAIRKEKIAYELVLHNLRTSTGGKAKTGTRMIPAGSSAKFPDFGFRVPLADGKIVYLLFEYKAESLAPFGSSRRWSYKNNTFVAVDQTDVSEVLTMEALNSIQAAKQGAQVQLERAKKYVNSSVSTLSRDMLQDVSYKNDKDKWERIFRFIGSKQQRQGDSLQILNATEYPSAFSIAENRYKAKFDEAARSLRADYVIGLVMVLDELWIWFKDRSIPDSVYKEVAKALGTDELQQFSARKGVVEARLAVPSKTKDRPDMIATVRLQKPSNGQRIRKL